MEHQTFSGEPKSNTNTSDQSHPANELAIAAPEIDQPLELDFEEGGSPPGLPFSASSSSSSSILRRQPSHPKRLTRANIVALQRTIGNLAVQRLLVAQTQSPAFIQRFNDKDIEIEKEKDKISDRLKAKIQLRTREIQNESKEEVKDAADRAEEEVMEAWQTFELIMVHHSYVEDEKIWGLMRRGLSEEEFKAAIERNSLFETIQEIIYQDKVSAFLATLNKLDQDALKAVLVWLNRSHKKQALDLKAHISPQDQQTYSKLIAQLNSILWQEVIAQPTVSVNATDLYKMPLQELVRLSKEQADWMKNLASAYVRDKLLALLKFAEEDFILSGCGEMQVSELINQGVIDTQSYQLKADKLTLLKLYSRSVQGDAGTVDLKYPVDQVTMALKWAKALERLINCPALGASLVKKIFTREGFRDLVNREEDWVGDFINYCVTAQPQLEANNGQEIYSYVACKQAGVDPVIYLNTNLRGRIRNFHRFTPKALQRLELNFQDKSKSKPLTLILHSALDENGAFHQDEHLESVILNNNLLVLLIEGKDSLAQISEQIEVLAETYGQAGKDAKGKIDQVMFIGHGNSRDIELAGPAKNRLTTTAKEPPNAANVPDKLNYQVGDNIAVSEFSTVSGVGKGEVGGQKGMFNIHKTGLKDKLVQLSITITTIRDYKHPQKSRDILDVVKGQPITVHAISTDKQWIEVDYQGKHGWTVLDCVDQAELKFPYRYLVKVTADSNSEGEEFPHPKYLRLRKGDTILAEELKLFEGWGFGTCISQGKEGWFRLIDTDVLGADERIHLSKNPERSDALFEKLLSHMAQDEDAAPHRRIVFNACLTNSNEIKVPLPLETELAKLQAVEYLKLNSSLAKHLQTKLELNPRLKRIRVIGANGATRKVILIDTNDDGLTIKPDNTLSTDLTAPQTFPDPALTEADKLNYVKAGEEPGGVMSAVLECWADKDREEALFKVLKERYETIEQNSWERIVIKCMFRICLQNFGNGELIRLLGKAAVAITMLQFRELCRVERLFKAGLSVGGKLQNVAVEIFQALPLTDSKLVEWIPLVVYQLWIKHDPSQSKLLLKELQRWSCAGAREFVDIEYLEGVSGVKIEDMLPLSSVKAPDREQLLLAFLVMAHNHEHAYCKKYLKEIIGTGKRFPKWLHVNSILQGNPNEEQILEYLDITTGGTDLPVANLDLDQDGINETYVEPVSLFGRPVQNPAIYVYQGPSLQQPKQLLSQRQELYILGEVKNFYAISWNAFATKVAFIPKKDVLLKK